MAIVTAPPADKALPAPFQLVCHPVMRNQAAYISLWPEVKRVA